MMLVGMLFRLSMCATLVGAPITGCLNGVEACMCEWSADDTDSTTLAGLSHPGDYSAAQIAATGLSEAAIKSADASPQACERVCCGALLITDAPAAAQAPAQTGPCDVWQHGGGTGAAGCWLGLDNTKRKPPLPEVPETSGGVWTGGTGKRCLRNIADPAAPAPTSVPAGPDVQLQLCSSSWGLYVLAMAAVGGGLYLGVGVAIGFRRGGGTRATAHPHFMLWQQLYGLVLDGVGFVRRRAGDGGSAHMQPDDEDGRRDKNEQKAKQGHRSSGEKKGKKERGKKAGREKEEPLLAAAPAAAAPAPTTTSASASGGGDGGTGGAKATASGGGGRWVHIPT
jgi:hypothetical protein|eukprot:COSAG06_NODE_1_length_58652_cov_31.600967_27_plen_339_part_00